MAAPTPRKSVLDSFDDDGTEATLPNVRIVTLVERPEACALTEAAARTTQRLSFELMDHQAFTADALQSAAMLLIECRIIEGYEDLGRIRTARQARPLMPIAVISANIDVEFMLSAYEAGASDYVAVATNAELFAARLVAMAKMSASAHLVEMQNEELLWSMKSLRREMDERKKAQDLAIESAKLASLGEMAGGIAHEIKTPLAVITGGISLLQEMHGKQAISGADAGEMLVDLEKMADRIAAIIRGLKSFSRQAEGDPFEPTSLGDIVRDTLALCDEVIEREGIALSAEFPEDLVLECQPTQISQVLLNLLSNARHAVGNSANAWIKVVAKDLGDQVEVAVTDSGAGIPSDLRAKVFLPFFTTKEKGVGTGLGLSISSKIAVAHSGSLIVDAACPNTRFVLTVPKKAVLPV